MPEITVIVTAYNLEKYIGTCLDELRAQTFRDFEVLIVDDCSKDQTMARAREKAADFPLPIRVIETPQNLGAPGKARNYALDHGNLLGGGYVIFLDGDDSIEPDFLEKLHTLARETGAEIAICAYDRFEEETGHVLCREMQGFPREIALPPQDDTLAYINGSLWNKLIRTETIGDTRIADFKVGEDLSFMLALYDKCGKIAFTDEMLIHYRVRSASIISNTQEETIYRFAGEVLRLCEQTPHPWMKDILAEVAFIHIGISMPLRAYSSDSIEMKPLLKWIAAYFADHFGGLHGCKWLSFPTVLRHGIRGAGLWGAKLCYWAHCFPLFLKAYAFLTRTLRIDIKF